MAFMIGAAPLFSLWAEPLAVHALVLDPAPRLVSLPAPERRFPTLTRTHPGAVMFERMIHDLWGLEALGAEDGRPLLDHGRWPVLNPLSGRPVRHAAPPPQPEFQPAWGEGVRQFPIGPVPPDMEEPLHWRLHLLGEAVLRAEAQPGFAHKGTLGLMLGKSARAAARFPARLAGDATVAHSLAFARAAEAALGVTVPPRAAALRRAMLEAERAAVLLQGVSRLAEAAGAPQLSARAALLREAMLRACFGAFGHRLMMDRVLPGGVAQDMAPEGLPMLLGAMAAIGRDWPWLLRAAKALAARLAGIGNSRPEAGVVAGGIPARAAGLAWDARADDELPPRAAVLDSADAAARLWLMLAECDDALRLLRLALDDVSPGVASAQASSVLSAPVPGVAGTGFALVEAARGPVLCWLRLDEGGLIAQAWLHDPSWGHLPMLETALAGAELHDAPVIRASIPISPSGMDL